MFVPNRSIQFEPVSELLVVLWSVKYTILYFCALKMYICGAQIYKIVYLWIFVVYLCFEICLFVQHKNPTCIFVLSFMYICGAQISNLYFCAFGRVYLCSSWNVLWAQIYIWSRVRVNHNPSCFFVPFYMGGRLYQTCSPQIYKSEYLWSTTIQICTKNTSCLILDLESGLVFL